MGDPAEMNFFSNPDELKSAMLEQALKVLLLTSSMIKVGKYHLVPTGALYAKVCMYHCTSQLHCTNCTTYLNATIALKNVLHIYSTNKDKNNRCRSEPTSLDMLALSLGKAEDAQISC